ncbi:MAG: hypothetical protein ACEPO2_18440 [Pelagibaca sp.]
MSTTPPTEIETSIQLALEAAAAANDAASDVATLSSDTKAAADRLDSFAQVMKPVMIGVVAGSVLAIAIGGLVYFRTLSEMRLATATQMEALALFSTSVDDLKAQIAAMETLDETLATLQTDQQDAFAALEATVQTAIRNPEAEAGAQSDTEGASPLDQQMLRGLSDTVEQNHQATRDAVTQGLSDLQLALSRMLADRPVAAATPQAAPRPVAKPATSPKPRPTARPAAQPRPNPYSFP